MNVYCLGNGVDYISTPITATFPAGVNSTTVDVPVIIDNVVEENETLQLEIFLPAPVKFAVQLGNPAKAIAIITDSSSMYVILTVNVFEICTLYSKYHAVKSLLHSSHDLINCNELH